MRVEGEEGEGEEERFRSAIQLALADMQTLGLDVVPMRNIGQGMKVSRSILDEFADVEGNTLECIAVKDKGLALCLLRVVTAEMLSQRMLLPIEEPIPSQDHEDGGCCWVVKFMLYLGLLLGIIVWLLIEHMQVVPRIQ